MNQVTPEYIENVYLLAERLYLAGNFKDAETLCYTLRWYDAGNTKHYKLSGAVQAALREYERSYNCFLQATVIDPKDPELWLCMGKAALHLNRTEEAQGHLNKAKELMEEDSKLGDAINRISRLIQ